MLGTFVCMIVVAAIYGWARHLRNRNTFKVVTLWPTTRFLIDRPNRLDTGDVR